MASGVSNTIDFKTFQMDVQKHLKLMKGVQSATP